MHNDELIKKLEAYGADAQGAMARFLDDEELYMTCLQMLIDDEAFDSLARAMASGDVKTAFEAAHTLKGVSGNLGLTPLYDAVCDLVEPLRHGENQGTQPLYERVRLEKDRLNELV